MDELVVDGLYEFKRKETYRDGLLIALLELCVILTDTAACKIECSGNISS